ncbi:uncharacterized protein METZ01_LOCUS118962 [marine metagenome]|uniref:Uncharacterized protein n=1 Tax=marine metagenome TaxID=408172 RepID=A0A381XN39_9ZZZZ
MADMENGSQEPREPTPEEQVQLQGVTIQSLKNQLANKCEEVANRDVQIALLQGQMQQQQQQQQPDPEPDDDEPALKAITQH